MNGRIGRHAYQTGLGKARYEVLQGPCFLSADIHIHRYLTCDARLNNNNRCPLARGPFEMASLCLRRFANVHKVRVPFTHVSCLAVHLLEHAPPSWSHHTPPFSRHFLYCHEPMLTPIRGLSSQTRYAPVPVNSLPVRPAHASLAVNRFAQRKLRTLLRTNTPL